MKILNTDKQIIQCSHTQAKSYLNNVQLQSVTPIPHDFSWGRLNRSCYELSKAIMRFFLPQKQADYAGIIFTKELLRLPIKKDCSLKLDIAGWIADHYQEETNKIGEYLSNRFIEIESAKPDFKRRKIMIDFTVDENDDDDWREVTVSFDQVFKHAQEIGIFEEDKEHPDRPCQTKPMIPTPDYYVATMFGDFEKRFLQDYFRNKPLP